MKPIDQLAKYNSKLRELKRLKSKLDTIDLRLENWDKLKAADLNGVAYAWEKDGRVKDAVIMPGGSREKSSIVEDSAIDREDMKEERERIELAIAELNEFIIDIDSKLDCMKYVHKYVLEKQYKEKKPIKLIVEEYNQDIDILTRKSLNNMLSNARNIFNKKK